MIAVISWVEKSRRGIERVTASYRVERAGPRLKRLGSVQTYFIAVCPSQAAEPPASGKENLPLSVV